MKHTTSKIFKALFIVFGILYPFAIFLALKSSEPQSYFIGMASFAFVFFVYEIKNKPFQFMKALAPACLFTLLLVAGLSEKSFLLKLYPLIINISLLVLFYSSLFTERSFVEKLARIQEPNLPVQAIKYTRRLTQVWVAFFALNSLMVIYTIFFADMQFWTFYNGLLSYILIGSLMTGEWVFRYFLKKSWREKNV